MLASKVRGWRQHPHPTLRARPPRKGEVRLAPARGDFDFAHEVELAVGGAVAAQGDDGAARAVREVEEAHEALGGEEDVEAVLAGAGHTEIVAGDALEALRPGLGPHFQ